MQRGKGWGKQGPEAAAAAGAGAGGGGGGGGPYPGLVVFDLDECVWSPEMFTLSHVPTASDAVSGELGVAGKGRYLQ